MKHAWDCSPQRVVHVRGITFSSVQHRVVSCWLYFSALLSPVPCWGIFERLLGDLEQNRGRNHGNNSPNDSVLAIRNISWHCLSCWKKCNRDDCLPITRVRFANKLTKDFEFLVRFCWNTGISNRWLGDSRRDLLNKQPALGKSSDSPEQKY